MSETAADADQLLAGMVALPHPDRLNRLRAESNPTNSLIRMAEACERLTLSRVAEALEASMMLVELADSVALPRPRVRCRRSRAQALAYAGRAAESLALCGEAIAIGREHHEQIETARTLLTSVHPLGDLARYDEALAAGSEAQAIFRGAGEPKLAAYADVNVGIIHQNRNQPAEALRHFDRARAALTDEPVRLGWLESNRGEALLQLHEFAAAEAAFRESLRVSEAAGSSLAAAIAEGNLADLAARRGLLRDALFHFERARRRMERDAAGSHLARLLAEQAEALESLGLGDDAVRSYESALRSLEKQGLRAESARARAGLGRLLLHRGQIEGAAAMLDIAANEFRALGDVVALAGVDLARAERLLRIGDPDGSDALLRSAEAALADRPLDLAAGYLTRARVAEARQDDRQAEALLTRGLALAEEFDLPPLRADLLHVRARLRRRSERFDDAIADYRAATHQIERIRSTLQADRLRYAYQGRRSVIFDELAGCLLTGPNIDLSAAFAAVEAAKSRALLDAVRSSVADHADDNTGPTETTEAELLARATAVRSDVNALYSRMFDRSGSVADSRNAAWRETLREREAELQELETRLSSGRGAVGLLAAPVGLSQAQAMLRDGEALIEYFIVDGEALAFVIHRDAVEVVRELCRADALRACVERVRFQLSRAMRPGAATGPMATRMLGDVRRELLAAWKSVAAPLLPYLRDATRIAIVPHGPLHHLPFHALWDGARHWIEKVEIRYSPSASLLCAVDDGRDDHCQPAPRRDLVIGYADGDAPQIAGEAAAIAAELPGCILLSGEDATVDAFYEHAPAARLIHIACHGWYSSQHPLSSGLKLADRWLTVRDVYSTRLSAALVVLSGCDTGRSRVDQGDELLGFLRGFFAAGARSLIVSQWLLHDAGAAEMMSALYRRLSGHAESVAAALRAVQIDALRQSPHPTRWAALAAVGAG